MTRTTVEREQRREETTQFDGGFRRLFETAADAMVTCSLDGTIVMVNAAAERLFGCSASELVGRPGSSLIAPASREAALAAMAEQAAGGAPSGLREFRAVRANGDEFVAEISPARTEWEGQPVVFSIVRDVTERKQAERALRDSDARHRALVDNVNLGIILVDRDFRVRAINASMCKAFEASPEHFVGEHCYRRLARRDEVCPECPGLRAMATGRPQETEIAGTPAGMGTVRLQAFPVFDAEGVATSFIEVTEDISERKRMQQALQDERDRLELITQAVGAGLAVISPDYHTLWANRVLKEWFGDVEGKPCHLAYNQRAEVCPGCGVREVFATGADRVTHEQVGVDVDGNPTWAQIIASPIRDADGNITAALELVVPITERKLAEERLRESETKYRLLFEHLGDAIFLADAETGIILETNQQAETLLGRDRDEIVGMHQTQLHPPGKGEEYARLFAQHVAQGRSADYDGEVVRKDGTIVSVAISAAYTEIAGRKLALGLFRDITERRRVEAETQYRNLLLSTQQEASLDAILVINEHGRMASFNRRFGEMWDVPNGVIESGADRAALQRAVTKVANPDEFMANIRHFSEPQADRDRGEIAMLDGRTLDRFSAPMMGPDGVYFGRVWFFRDITDQKRMQQALQTKNRELESFVYTVSHDLRSPLISMEGFARLLADGYDDRLDDEGRDYLRRVRANVGAMNALLTDLLELSRVGRLEEPREPVAIAAVISEVLEDLAGSLRAAEGQVTVAADLPTVLYSRPRLSQVFANLISNAVKFSRDGIPPRIEVSGEAREREYRITVRDNGIGLPEGPKRDKIFEIFTRLQQKKVEGTGVGLAIVKRIVEDHGGTVGVDSTPGEGSAFWFTIPGQLEHE